MHIATLRVSSSRFTRKAFLSDSEEEFAVCRERPYLCTAERLCLIGGCSQICHCNKYLVTISIGLCQDVFDLVYFDHCVFEDLCSCCDIALELAELCDQIFFEFGSYKITKILLFRSLVKTYKQLSKSGKSDISFS